MKAPAKAAGIEAREPRTIGAGEPVSAGYPGALLAHLDVSVVVPTWRRPDLLRTCLDALVRQDCDPARYEIIVCDDGPDDATRATVEAFSAGHLPRGLAIRYVPVTATQGPAGARNAGWRAARAPLIAFTDDDTQPASGWLRAGVAALERADAAAGRIVVPLGDAPTDYERDAGGLARAEFATANAFVRRTRLAQTGGFDERFTAAWREDSDLQFMLMNVGAQVVRADDALVVHPVRPARWGVSLAQQKKSRYDALLFRKHPQLYRQRIASGPPLLYYAILCAALWVLVALLFDRPDVAAVACAVWLALTAGFCVRRLRGTRRSVAHIAEMAWTSVWIPFLSIYWRLNGAVRYRVWFL